MMWFVSDFTDVTRKITPEKHSIHKKILIDKIFFFMLGSLPFTEFVKL